MATLVIRPGPSPLTPRLFSAPPPKRDRWDTETESEFQHQCMEESAPPPDRPAHNPQDSSPARPAMRLRTSSSSDASMSPRSHSTRTIGDSSIINGSQRPRRPRRRADEVARLYNCAWEGCVKAYSTLSHLQDHVCGHTRRR